MQHDHAGHCRARRRAAAAAGNRGQPLARAQQLESRNRKPLLGLDREAVRRAGRRHALMEGVARGAARSLPQSPVQPPRPARRLDGHDRSSRLRRSSLLLARLFRLQDGLAVRIHEMHARRRRRRAEVPRMVEHSESRAAACARASARAKNRRAHGRDGRVPPGGSRAAGRAFTEQIGVAQAARPRRRIWRVLALVRRRRGAFRNRANGAERR